EEWQRDKLHAVKLWANQKKYPFLYLGGKSGAGKTHLGVAAFYSLVQRGVRGKYMSWRTESRDLKMRMTEFGFYDEKIRELKRVPLLMLDDFLWTNKCEPSEEDFKLAKEIIDERQAANLRTIFTANYTIKELNDMTEVVGGRIYEACGSKTNFALTYGNECKNYRARTQERMTLTEIEDEAPFDD
ncbi:MAG: ATP-binding protein, partial [Clostridia bacterium]|nr:ATP-binding protein [Clostridia bacterium]